MKGSNRVITDLCLQRNRSFKIKNPKQLNSSQIQKTKVQTQIAAKEMHHLRKQDIEPHCGKIRPRKRNIEPIVEKFDLERGISSTFVGLFSLLTDYGGRNKRPVYLQRMRIVPFIRRIMKAVIRMEDKQTSNKSTETGGNTVSKVDWNYPVPQYLMKLQTKVDAPEHLINEVYGKWADTFEQDSINSGYASHIHCSQIFNATALKYHNEKAKSIRIIDVGAGTGVVGGLLKGLGYANVDGIDCCDVMLQKARDRNIYKNTFVNFVDERRFESIEDGMYDALISSGSISPPLIQARAFNEMIRWVKKGGFLCFTLREDALDEERFGYTEQIKKLEEENKWKLISKEKVDYCKREGSENVFASKAYICVYEIL